MELHSLASYPIKFKQTVISPTKICLQFEEVHVKLRTNDKAAPLQKMHDTCEFLPIRTDGQLGEDPKGLPRTATVQILDIGCQMPTIEDLQYELLQAYSIYYTYNKEVYKNTYGKEFIDFLQNIHTELGEIIECLKDQKKT